MGDIEEITAKLRQFRDDRDWSQFHNSKDLALALSIEVAELNELFLWKDPEDVNVEKLKDELADVFAYGLFLLEKHGFNFREILEEKIKQNEKKYPIALSKGKADKYDKL